MNSELTAEFIKLFRQLPNRTQKTAKKNYRLWKQNPQHPSVEFKNSKPVPPFIRFVQVSVGVPLG
jgi:hypothetical protein